MKHIITIIVLCAGIHLEAGAQTFTQRIQQPQTGKSGSVSIHQSAEIDELVNTAQLSARRTTPVAETTKATSTASANADRVSANNHSEPMEEASTMPVDNTKKIMRGHKISGYRVQAFAGGNSRKDRQQAERIGDQIKASYPSEPVYVHFYSPRWICRVGNYRTYEEAHQMLISLRKLGFQQATIVKGKITVSN